MTRTFGLLMFGPATAGAAFAQSTATSSQAPSAELIREHTTRSGFQANRITPIAAVLDPTTAGR